MSMIDDPRERGCSQLDMLVFESLNITFTLILVIRPLSNSMLNGQSISQSISLVYKYR